MFAPADRPRLLALIKTQHTAFERYIRVHLALADYDKPQKEHYELLKLCRSKDLDAAIDLLTRHIEDISRLLSAHVRKDTDAEASGSVGDMVRPSH